MEEASAGMLFLAGGGVVRVVVRGVVRVVGVDSAADFFAVFGGVSCFGVSSGLLPMMALSTLSNKSEAAEVVGLRAESSKVSNSAFGPGSVPDDRLLLRYFTRSSDGHLDE